MTRSCESKSRPTTIAWMAAMKLAIMFIVPARVPVWRSPMSAAAAQAGAIARSLPKKARVKRKPSATTFSTQGTARIASPATVRPARPTIRRPQRLPQRRDDHVGERSSHQTRHDSEGKWQRRQPAGGLRGEMTMIFQVGRQERQIEVAAEAEEPIHEAERPDAARPEHPAPGNVAVARRRARAARPASISFRSARLTCGISSGRLRNHGQNPAHQARPSTATSTSGIFQSPIAAKSQTRRSGASAPPSRLDIQIVPWAEPRSVVGIQSAVIREIDGKVPAWNAPKRNRSTTRNDDDHGARFAAGKPRGPGKR